MSRKRKESLNKQHAQVKPSVRYLTHIHLNANSPKQLTETETTKHLKLHKPRSSNITIVKNRKIQI